MLLHEHAAPVAAAADAAVPTSVALAQKLDDIRDLESRRMAAATHVLRTKAAALQEDIARLERSAHKCRSAGMPYYVRPLRFAQRQHALVQRALHALATTRPAELERRLELYALRGHDVVTAAAHARDVVPADGRGAAAAAQQQQQQQQQHVTAHQYLPTAPVKSASTPSGPAPGGADATPLLSKLLREMDFLHQVTLEPRAVELTPFDTCEKCRAVMHHNPNTQTLVCPTRGCNHWKRFPDMTSHALPYNEDVLFQRYTYRPVTHLEEIIRTAEAREASVVPHENLALVMLRLKERRIQPHEVTISLIRSVLSEVGMRGDHAVQIYCRITGRAPRRMTQHQIDILRILFNLQEEPYQRHRGHRINRLSLPFNAYKLCELLGYFEMLESFQLLRGQQNLEEHDRIYAQMCDDLNWEKIPTIVTPGSNTIAAVMFAQRQRLAVSRRLPPPPPPPPQHSSTDADALSSSATAIETATSSAKPAACASAPPRRSRTPRARASPPTEGASASAGASAAETRRRRRS